MPKIEVEVTQARDDEINRRLAGKRAVLRALPPPKRTETLHATEARARAAAARVGLPHVEVTALETSHGWLGVVLLRPDQTWMASIVAERGCRAGVKS